VTISVGQAAEDLWVKGDNDRLMQVAANLISNAVKFSPAKGAVVLSAARHDEWVRIEIKDAGPGIPEEFQPRIFQKFAQAAGARQKGGTGLGLNIAKTLIEKHGGNIGFTTVKDGGTTFYFELPAWQEEDKKV
jgi:signal transduction histidine kinase